jgi:hypothetical protein
MPTPAPLPLYRVHVTVGFASSSGAVSFEAAGNDLSLYTHALVKTIDAFGHQKDVVQLLEEVRADVTQRTASLGVTQTPCVYSAKEGRVVLVSLVGSTPLSAGAAVTVGDAVRPILNHLVPQVSQHPFLRCRLSSSVFRIDIVYLHRSRSGHLSCTTTWSPQWWRAIYPALQPRP